MPKLKTNRAAAKRFRKTASGSGNSVPASWCTRRTWDDSSSCSRTTDSRQQED